MFDHAARAYPTRDVRTFFTEQSLSFRDLADRGRALAGGLLAAGVEPGTPVAVLARSSLDTLQAVHGIAAAAAVAVPLAASIGRGKTSLARLVHVVEDAGIAVAVVDEKHVELVAETLPGVRPLSLPSLLATAAADGKPATELPAVAARDPALIQYTSGSTSRPRGVELTHGNVLAGVRALHHGVDPRDGDVLCHWLPLSHDMGLISALAAVAGGVDLRLSPQRDFVMHPDDWLRAAGELGATILAGPSFFYRHLVDSIPRQETASYDLSAVRAMLNGAEPIEPDLPAAFAHHFAASGLAPEAMKPCYGLAEATLAVTITPLARGAAVDWVDRAELNDRGRAMPVAAGVAGARGIVDCGVPVPEMEVRVLRDGRAVGERRVGDIEVRGAAVMRGYHREPAPTVSPDGWCPTGDLGYLAAGCLHVTGRRKEMMILGGQNYYPQDVETAVRRVAGVYRENAIACVIPPDAVTGGPERIGVLAEIRDASPPFGGIVAAIRDAAAVELGGASVDVVLLRRNGLLRTTSGKFQRLLMRRRLLAGTLDRVLIRVGADEPLPES